MTHFVKDGKHSLIECLLSDMMQIWNIFTSDHAMKLHFRRRALLGGFFFPVEEIYFIKNYDQENVLLTKLVSFVRFS